MIITLPAISIVTEVILRSPVHSNVVPFIVAMLFARISKNMDYLMCLAVALKFVKTTMKPPTNSLKVFNIEMPLYLTSEEITASR